jgi:hypothetical protein
MSPERDDDRHYVGRQYRGFISFGPVGSSATEVRFRHLATVF